MGELVPECLNHNNQSYIFKLTENNYEHLWAEIAEKNSEQIIQNTLTQAAGPGIFVIKMSGADYLLDTINRSVVGPLDRRPPDKRVLLSLAYYLNGATPDSLSSNIVPEKVLPGGDRFFAGTHALKREPILSRFASSGSELVESAEALGAEIISRGPNSFSFTIKLTAVRLRNEV